MIFRFKDEMTQGQIALLLIVSLILVACGKTDISDVEHVNRAKQYQTTGDFKATLIELKNALQQNPKNSEARLLLGELYVLIGNGAAAEKELNKALQLGVTGSYIQKLQGKSLLLQGHHEDVLTTLSKMDVSSQADLLVLRGEAQLGLRKNNLAQTAFREALLIKPDDSAALLGQARVYLVTGVLQKAVDKVAKVLKSDPDNAEAWVLQGKVANQQERVDDAQAAYQRAIELVTANLVTRVGMTARMGLTKLLILQRKFDEAAAHVKYLLKASPNNPESNYMAGLLEYERKQYDQARDYFQTVLETAPDHLPSVFLLGSVNYALGNVEQAEQQLARVVTVKPDLLPARMLLASLRLQQAQADQVLEILEPALAQNPNSARLLAMASQAALKGGELDRGKEYLQRAIAQKPDESSLRGQLAMLFLAEGNDQQAIKELERAIADGNAPQREQALLILTYLKKSDFDKAVDLSQKLVADHPNSAFPHNLLGVALGGKGDMTLARASFLAALKIENGYVSALLNLARLDISSGRVNDAVKRLDEVLAREEGNVSAIMVLAQLEESQGNLNKALVLMEKARALNPQTVQPRIVLANYYQKSRQQEKALEVTSELIMLQPDNPVVIDLHVNSLYQNKKSQLALSLLKKLVNIQPKEPFNFIKLAQIHLDQGSKSKAREALIKASNLRKGYYPAAAALARLEMEEGNISKALQIAEEIKRYHPKSAAGYALAGDVHMFTEQYLKAAKSYTTAAKVKNTSVIVIKLSKALILAGNDWDTVRKPLDVWLEKNKGDLVVWAQLAGTAYEMGRSDFAITQYQQMLEENPDNAIILNELAWISYEKNKSQKAVEFAKRAYELNPKLPQIQDTLGWILVQEGKMIEGIKLLESSHNAKPDIPEISYHLAVALMKNGDKQKAIDLLEKTVLTKEKFPSRAEAEKLLKKL